MPTKYNKPQAFAMTALDKEILSRCRYDIDLWARGYFDGQVFPYQSYFYHAPQKDKLLIAGIRTGKSRLVSMGSMHICQFNPGIRFLNTSISSEQAKIVYQNCVELIHKTNRFSHWIEHIQASPYPLIRMVNGSELWFRSIGYEAELLRGFEFDVINLDEAAYVTSKTAVDTLQGRLLGYNNLTNKYRLGIFWMTSSPKGQGWLNDRFKQGDPKYAFATPQTHLSLRVPTTANPLLSKEELDRIMANYTNAMIQQEIFGEFLDNMDAVFPYHAVMAACQPDLREVKWLTSQVEIWNTRHEVRSVRLDAGLTDDITHYECDPQAGHRYVSSWDLGKKTTKSGRNAMVGLVFDITHEPWVMVAFRYAEGMGYVEAKSEIERWHEKYSGNGSICSTVIDSTGKGDVLQEFIERERTVDDLEGIVYSSANKPNLIHAGKIAVERELTRFPFIRRMVDQLTNYVLEDKDIAQDIVMAYCQAMYRAREMTRISEGRERSVARLVTPNYRMGAMYNPRYVQSRLARRNQRITQINRRRTSG